jgi:glycosyltransferase involved in cell wall biosynthesis
MNLSVAICTRDRPALLGDCLHSVLACEYRPCEVIVVDQSADRRTRELVAALQHDRDELTYVATETRGLSAARNLAIERTTGDALAFTDDDCLADVGWLGAVAEEFSVAVDVAAVCGRSLPIIEAPLVADPASVRTDSVRRLFRGPCSPWRIGNGSNMAFRTDALRAVGPFDERLGPGARFHGGEEADLLYRLLTRGYRLLYSPRPLVYHRQWRDASQQLALFRGYGIGIGAFGAKQLRSGDVRGLRTLGGWGATTVADLMRGLGARDLGRARAAARLLGGLVVGAIQMGLLPQKPACE